MLRSLVNLHPGSFNISLFSAELLWSQRGRFDSKSDKTKKKVMRKKAGVMRKIMLFQQNLH